MMLRRHIKRILPWLWLGFCFLLLMLFLHRNLNSLLDSDMASDLVLAKLIADTGKLVPTEWYYSTEVYLFGMQWFYAPLFFITDNWHFVRLGGMAASLLCMLACFYYLCSQLHLRRWFPLAGSMLLLPSSIQYADLVLFSGFYTQYVIVSFLTLGMMIHHFKAEKPKVRLFLLVLLALIALMVGATGLRMLLFLYIPAFLCSLVLLPHSGTRAKRLLISSSLCLVFSGIGFLLNSTVLPLYYSYMHFGDMYFSAFDPERILTVFNDWLSFLGFQPGESFFSLALLNALLCFGQLLLVFLAVHASLRKQAWAELPTIKKLPVLTYAFGIGLYAALLSVSDAPYAPHYLVPAAVLTPVTIISFLSECRLPRFFRRLLPGFLAVLLAFSGLQNYLLYSEEDTNDEIQSITASLVHDGYQNGYATFWNGNIVTELSSGRIDMRVWPADETMDISSIYRWLQAKEHEGPEPEGKTFLLFSKWYEEEKNRMLGQWLHEKDKYWETENYLVYGYESYDELLNSVEQQYSASFNGRQWAYGSHTPHGTLAAGASTALPSMPLYPGSYTVTLTGGKLTSLTMECAHNGGKLAPVLISAEDDRLVFAIETPELLHGLRISYINNGASPAEPAAFELRKTGGLQ